MRKYSIFALLVACTPSVVSSTALATGPTKDAPTTVAKGPAPALSAHIAKEKALHPAVFQQVTAIRDRVPALDRAKRGRIAAVAPLLRTLGTDALLPMLELLMAPDAAAGFSESARVALQVGLLEALGDLRDPVAAPAFEAVLSGPETNEAIVRAASSALGKLRDDVTASKLASFARQPGPKQSAIVAGLGSCRRPQIARVLSDLTQASVPRATRLSAIEALGTLGSRWAWQTPELASSGEGQEVRATAARSLLLAYKDADAESRSKAEHGILMVDDPSTPAQIQAAKEAASPELRAALERLAERFAQSPVHDR